MTVRYVLAAGLVAAGWMTSAAAQENIGVTAAVVNLVHGTLAEQERTLVIGDRLFHNEAIETEVESSTQLLFLDETTMSIGPESRLVLDTFVFDPDPNVSKVVMSATVGVFRFVSGSLASASYEIRTPVAVIGVRGTIFDLFVEAVTGATTVILRAGALAISNLEGVTVNIDTPGLASTVAAPDAAPTPPASPPPHVTRRIVAAHPGVPALEAQRQRLFDSPLPPITDLIKEPPVVEEPEAVPRIESGTGCFTADTKVLMADNTFKPIAEIEEGDEVQSFDFNTNKKVNSKVTRLFTIEAASYFLLNDNLKVTGTHPFAVGNDVWKEAAELKVGDKVLGNSHIKIKSIKKVEKAVQVFNLTVNGTHNYFVSDEDEKEVFLVHNKIN